MSIAVGIDAGYDSHVVARMVVPTELTSEPTIEIQKNESNESEFKWVIFHIQYRLGVKWNIQMLC